MLNTLTCNRCGQHMGAGYLRGRGSVGYSLLQKMSLLRPPEALILGFLEELREL